jgi:hypothetical protein
MQNNLKIKQNHIICPNEVTKTIKFLEENKEENLEHNLEKSL